MATITRGILGYGQMAAYRTFPLTYTGPVSYTTNGEAFGLAQLGMVPHIITGSIAWDGISAVRLVVWDPVNSKMLWFVPNTGAEVANGTNLSTFKVGINVIGK